MSIKYLTTKDELPDILTTSPHYSCEKIWGQERRMCILILKLEKCMGTRKENVQFDIEN